MRRYKSLSLRRHKQNDKIENAINEPIIMMQDEQNKKFAVKIEPKLDAYLHDETFFDVSCKRRPSLSKKHYTLYARKQRYVNLNL